VGATSPRISSSSQKEREALDAAHRAGGLDLAGAQPLDRGRDLAHHIGITQRHDLATYGVGDLLQDLRVGPGHDRLSVGAALVMHTALFVDLWNGSALLGPGNYAEHPNPCLIESRGCVGDVSLQVFTVGEEEQDPSLAFLG